MLTCKTLPQLLGFVVMNPELLYVRVVDNL